MWEIWKIWKLASEYVKTGVEKKGKFQKIKSKQHVLVALQ